MLAKPPGLALPCLAWAVVNACPTYLSQPSSFIHSFIHSFIPSLRLVRQSHYGAIVLQPSRRQQHKRTDLIERHRPHGRRSLSAEILQESNIGSVCQRHRRRVPNRVLWLPLRQLKTDVPAETWWDDFISIYTNLLKRSKGDIF